MSITDIIKNGPTTKAEKVFMRRFNEGLNDFIEDIAKLADLESQVWNVPAAKEACTNVARQIRLQKVFIEEEL